MWHRIPILSSMKMIYPFTVENKSPCIFVHTSSFTDWFTSSQLLTSCSLDLICSCRIWYYFRCIMHLLRTCLSFYFNYNKSSWFLSSSFLCVFPKFCLIENFICSYILFSKFTFISVVRDLKECRFNLVFCIDLLMITFTALLKVI